MEKPTKEKEFYKFIYFKTMNKAYDYVKENKPSEIVDSIAPDNQSGYGLSRAEGKIFKFADGTYMGAGSTFLPSKAKNVYYVYTMDENGLYNNGAPYLNKNNKINLFKDKTSTNESKTIKLTESNLHYLINKIVSEIKKIDK